MATQVNVSGAALVKVDTGASHSLETLGYTRDGVEVRFEARYLDVPSDDMGGEAGPPTEVQYLGEIAVIRLELTKYDPAVANKIQRLYDQTPGQPGTPGTLLFSAAETYRLVIDCADTPLNFPRCFLRDAIEINKGTRFSRLLMVFEAHKDASGVLWNNTV